MKGPHRMLSAVRPILSPTYNDIGSQADVEDRNGRVPEGPRRAVSEAARERAPNSTLASERLRGGHRWFAARSAITGGLEAPTAQSQVVNSTPGSTRMRAPISISPSGLAGRAFSRSRVCAGAARSGSPVVPPPLSSTIRTGWAPCCVLLLQTDVARP
jgi:hypothetical protein